MSSNSHKPTCDECGFVAWFPIYHSPSCSKNKSESLAGICAECNFEEGHSRACSQFVESKPPEAEICKRCKKEIPDGSTIANSLCSLCARQQEVEKCQCRCHETSDKLEHETACCKEMNGYLWNWENYCNHGKKKELCPECNVCPDDMAPPNAELIKLLSELY